mgnify:FL=1
MNPSPNDLANIEEQAAEWLLVLDEKFTESETNRYPDELNDWLAQSTVHREVFEKMQSLWTASTTLSDDFVTQQLAELDAVTSNKTNSKYRSITSYLAIAASCLLFGFIFLVNQESPLKTMSTVSPQASANDKVSNEFFHTTINEHRSFTLDDGSQIDLGANTQLAVRYSRASRELILYQGEALFNVSKDKQRPFVVRYQNSEVTALGTVFNVRANPASIRVDVLEGSVSVAQQDAVTLTQGQAVEMTKAGKVTHTKAQGDSLTMSWQKGYLVYQNARLGDVLNDVARYSEVQVNLSDKKLTELTYNGTFLTTEIEGWLSSLEKIYPITVTQKGRVFTLTAD